MGCAFAQSILNDYFSLFLGKIMVYYVKSNENVQAPGHYACINVWVLVHLRSEATDKIEDFRGTALHSCTWNFRSVNYEFRQIDKL